MNMRTNRRVMGGAFPIGDICYSGILSTAGGLVFVGRNNQTLQAYDDQHGQAPLDVAQAGRECRGAADDLQVDGKQFVAVYAGGNGIASGYGTAKVKYGSDLYTFALPR